MARKANVNVNSKTTRQTSTTTTKKPVAQKPAKEKTGVFSLFGINKKKTEMPEKAGKTRKSPAKVEQTEIETDVSNHQSNRSYDKEKSALQGKHNKPSKRDIAQNYTQCTDKQYVFMYMTHKYFGKVQKFYNEEFENITILGTSSVYSLLDVFKTKTVSNTILLFLFYQEEVEGTYNFLKKIGFKSLDRRILNILIVPRVGVDISVIINDKELAPYISKMEPVVINETHPLNTSLLEKAISAVVQNQPVYIEHKKQVEPKKVTYKESSISKLYKMDIDALQAKINKVKQATYDRNMKNKIVQAVATTKTGEDLDHFISQIPHINIIEEAERDIDAYIETFENSPHLKNHLEDIIKDKFLLGVLKTAEVKNIMDEIINKASKKLESYDYMRSEFNYNAINELNDMKAEAIELQKKRMEIKKKVEEKCREYKLFVQLITNSHTIEERCEAQQHNMLAKLIQDNPRALSANEVSVITDHMKTLQLEINKSRSEKNAAQRDLENMLEYQKDVFKGIKLLVDIDEVVIQKLVDIIVEEQEVKDIKRYTDTRLQTIGVNIVALEGSGVNTIFELIKGNRDLFFYIGGEKQHISKRQFTLSQFLEPSWEICDTPVIWVSEDEAKDYLNDMKLVNRVLNKLDFIARDYNNIYIIQHTSLRDESLICAFMVESVRKIGNLVYFTKPDNERAIAINTIHNSIKQDIPAEEIYSLRLVVNQRTEAYKEYRSDFRVLCGINAKEIGIPYKADMNNISGKMLQNLKMIKGSMR